MQFLLSYSSDHFDPSRPVEDQANWGTSANVISRTLHAALAKRGEVTFVDAAEPGDLSGRHFDAFIGIQRDFGGILESCEVDRSILVAVNMHPAEHNRLLLDFMVNERLPTSALHPLDVQDAGRRSRDIAEADAILLFGNVRTLNSYTRNDIPSEKIKLVNHGADLGPQAPTARPEADPADTQILYCASEIGLRKGFDVLEAVMRDVDLGGLGAHLHVVGAASYPHYQERLRELEAQLEPHVTNHGWLQPGSAEYRELLDRIDFLFFPSLEEGQAGTVLESMSRGVIPLISGNCGVDFAPLGFCELETASAWNRELVKRTCALSESERTRLRDKTLEFYDEFHAGFESGIERALGDALDGSIRPQVSVVLPVHDKAPILRDLLRVLDRALIAYGAADLCVILDGCTDASEAIARRFFEGRTDYPVEIVTTPDIFEVRSNNLGLRRARGRYAVIVQDDNFIYQRDCIQEGVTFLEKSRRAAILGGLAGVNFYPRETRGLEGPGQIVADDNEVYWRQDANTNPALGERVFQVDACMRGPLFFSKAFLEDHGYLDEEYVPVYADDMDICFRAASVGRKVYCMLMDVENDSLSMKSFDAEKARWWTEVVRRNMNLFYSRWSPSTEKDYLWLHRTPLAEDDGGLGEGIVRLRQRARRRYLAARGWFSAWSLRQTLGGLRARLRG